MAYINDIQQAILQLEGGAFQKLFDRYLMKKYKFKNIQSLGVQVGTNKPTKGVPDSYVVTDEGNYILINYGTVAKNQEEKIRKDILACFDDSKLQLPKEKIEKIICGHTLSNMHIEAYDRIRNLIDGEKIELISIEKLSHDLADEYPHIAKEELGISMDSGQFFDIEDFVEVSDASGINAPISFDFYFRESEMTELVQSIHMNKVTIMTGPSGIGKTRLALEFCRKLEREGFKIYCIRSNGNLLYEDIKRYVSDPEKYLLFFDDANMISSLDNALDTLFNLLNKYEIKVLITVRDYAQKKVIEVAEKYPTYSTHSIERFKNNEIKEILEKNLNILNSWYLDQITDIAKGNIRLAILAGKISIDKGYAELKNAEDIFKNYYGRIFEEARLSKEDILMLFIITAAGPVRNGMNPFYENLKKKYGDTIPQTDTIEKLHELELIDWFKSEITKISDQSFGNYILYYVLYEKKWVKIEDFISIGFPQNRKKVGYVLDTLKNIFDSKELSKYLNDSILSAWEKCPQDQEAIYLHAFCLVNPNKTLSILLNKIRHEKDINFDLRNYDIDSKKNFSRINNDIIEILGNFKYMDSFEEAVDLLLLYFSKRPDLFMNFYFVICEKFLFDEYSINLDYQHEMVLLNKLWESTETGSNYNNSLLYLHIVENALKTNRSFTRTSRNDNSIKFITFNLPFNDTIRQLRKTIIEHLAILRKKEEYRDRVNKILLSDQFHLYENENIEMYLKTDFDTIFEVVIDKNDPDFFDALIIGHYETIVNNIGGEIDDRYLVALRNPKYKIYKLLSVDSEYAYTKKEENEEHKKLISKEIGSYNVDDYQKMFEVCIFLETVIPLKDHWAIRSSLDYVFKILEDNSDLYIQVIEAYFLVNAPFNSCSLYHQIDYLLAHIGYERTLSLVNRIEFDKKDICQT